MKGQRRPARVKTKQMQAAGASQRNTASAEIAPQTLTRQARLPGNQARLRDPVVGLMEQSPDGSPTSGAADSTLTTTTTTWRMSTTRTIPIHVMVPRAASALVEPMGTEPTAILSKNMAVTVQNRLWNQELGAGRGVDLTPLADRALPTAGSSQKMKYPRATQAGAETAPQTPRTVSRTHEAEAGTQTQKKKPPRVRCVATQVALITGCSAATAEETCKALGLPPLTKRNKAEAIAGLAAAGLKYPGLPRQCLPPVGFGPGLDHLGPEDQLIGTVEAHSPTWEWPHEEFEEEVLNGDKSTWQSSDSSPSTRTGWSSSTQEQAHQATPNNPRHRGSREEKERQERPPRPGRHPGRWVDCETTIGMETWRPAAQPGDT